MGITYLHNLGGMMKGHHVRVPECARNPKVIITIEMGSQVYFHHAW